MKRKSKIIKRDSNESFKNLKKGTQRGDSKRGIQKGEFKKGEFKRGIQKKNLQREFEWKRN